MILIPCPYCGHRNVSEFHYVGEAKGRPEPESATAEQWRTYLYLRRNPAGHTTEGWFHRSGCGRFLKVERDTITNEILSARAATATEEAKL